MTLPVVLAERCFTAADQIAFATLSGDWNPMHMDAVAARRTQAGSPVVHGIHAVAWALNAWAQRFGTPLSALSLIVRFDRFIYLDQVVEARIAERGETGFLIVLSVGGVNVTSIRANAAPSAPDRAETDGAHVSAALAEARSRDIGDLEGTKGAFKVAVPQALTNAFPALVDGFGPGTVGSLIALSTLVGMHAPGLHSIFSKFAVVLQAAPQQGVFSYRVTKVQPLLRAVEMAVRGPGLSGTASGFVRRPPVPQPSAAALKSVAPDCSGHRVLVVGGSRGLGEITAKLCAMGGGDVTLTYTVGSADAEAVRDDIIAQGGRCNILRLDVNESVGGLLGTPSAGFTHAYYFATSQIFGQKAEGLARQQLSRFLDIHLYGFNAVCDALAVGGRPVKIFYPSSVAVEEKPNDVVEYVIAKMAGELLSDALTSRVPNLTIVVERLPRTDTDQTATVLPVRSAAAVDVMTPIIQAMHSGGRT